jgi:hypothetical protein
MGLLENIPASSDTDHEQGRKFDDPAPKSAWRAHRWHLVTFQWNVGASSRTDYSALSVNASPAGGWYGGLGDLIPDPDPTQMCLTRDAYRIDGTFGAPRFYNARHIPGALPGIVGAADATLDEMMFYTVSSDMAQCQMLATLRYPGGRFSKEDEALDPTKPEYSSAPIPLGTGARLLRIDWTLVLPRLLSTQAPFPPDVWPSPNRIFYGTGDDMPSGKTADAAVSVLDAARTPLLTERLTRSGSVLNLAPPGGTLKLGLNLRPRLGDNVSGGSGDWTKANAPLLESPLLDDITLTFTGPLGPRMTAWQEGD